MTPKDIPGNGNTLASLSQELKDHIKHQDGQWSEMGARLKEVEGSVDCLLKEKGTKLEGWLKSLLPVILSILLLGGGWIYSLSQVSNKVAELEGGRIENRANIQLIQQQIQDKAIQDALRDERYKVILERLQIITDKISKLK
jgi:hypothetical protein